LKSVNALISIGEDYPIARPKVSILAKPVGGHEKALWTRIEVCFPAIGGRSLWHLALEAHVVREHHFNIERLDFEFKLVA
jgi:hypothetical protein